MVVAHLLLEEAQDELDDDAGEPVDGRRDGEGNHVALARHEGLGGGEHLGHTDGEGQGGVFDQRDDLVAHGGKDALEHLAAR